MDGKNERIADFFEYELECEHMFFGATTRPDAVD